MRQSLHLFITSCIIALGIGCSDSSFTDCPDDVALLSEFIDPEGVPLRIYADGQVYETNEEGCRLLGVYFDPDFLTNTYIFTDSGVFYNTTEGLFPTLRHFTEPFETYASFNDMFVFSIADTQKRWNHFTCQSPAFPEVNDYNALRDCIWDGSCSFIDNRIELAPDITGSGSTTLQFTAVAPTGNMVTSKASIESQLPFFQKGDDLWFEARYLVVSGMPFSLVDFENTLFDGYPGPRVVLRDGALAFENKFGDKRGYEQSSPVSIPLGSWFTLKVHLRLSDTNDGILQLWQDGNLLIDATGYNIPTANSIQNSLEVGISATSVATVLQVDDVRISDSPF